MKKILLSILSAVVISACGLLDENPTTSLSEDVYNSNAGLESLIRGTYRAFYGDALFQGNMNELLHDCSGLIHWKNATTRLTSEAYTSALKFAQYSTNSQNNSQFNSLYTAINRCNLIISHIPDSQADEDYKTEIEGEAKFLRGVLYFYLARLYGDVPLILTPPQRFEDMYQPRTAYYKVYAQIVSDLKEAEQKMRTQARVDEVTGGTQSRPNKYAATSFLASVYLQIGSILDSPDDQFFDTSKDAALIAAGKDPRTPDFSAIGISSAGDAWTLCLQACEKVISEGPYKLADSFGDLFRWTDPEDFTLPERIFVLTACAQQETGIYTAIRSLPEYPEGTLAKTAANNNYARWRPTRFLFQKWCETYPGAKGTGAENYNVYVSSSDPRLGYSFMYNSYKNQNTNTKENLYPANSRIFGTATYGQPCYRKYLDPKYDCNAGYADFYMMRYAEIFLMASEACASLSQTPGDQMWNKAFDYMEIIHARARRSVAVGQPEAEQPKWTADRFADKKELIEGIFWERMFEMTGEGHEFYDTHRRGATFLRDVIAVPKNAHLLLPEQSATLNYEGKAVSTPWIKGLYGDLEFQYPTDVQQLRKSIVCAFPRNELIRNTSLDETEDANDFYWK